MESVKTLFSSLWGGGTPPPPGAPGPAAELEAQQAAPYRPPDEQGEASQPARRRGGGSTRPRRERERPAPPAELERQSTPAAGLEVNEVADYGGGAFPGGGSMAGGATSSQAPPPRGAAAPPELSPDLQELVNSGEMSLQQAQELMAEMMGGDPLFAMPPPGPGGGGGGGGGRGGYATPPPEFRQPPPQLPTQPPGPPVTMIMPPTAGGRSQAFAQLPPQDTLPDSHMTMEDQHRSGLLLLEQESMHSGSARLPSRPSATSPPPARRGVQPEGNLPSASSMGGSRRQAYGTAAVAAEGPQVEGSIVGGRLRLRVVRALSLRNTALGIMPGDVSDPFVVARVGRQEFKTEVIENSLNPIWNSRHFEFAVESEDAVLELEVFNSQQWHAHDSLGKMAVRIAELVPGKRATRCDRLDEGDAYRSDGKQASLEVELLYLTAHQLAGGGGAIVAQAGQGAIDLVLKKEKKKPNWVPLPSFHGLGPEAFEAPKPEIDEAPVGQQRRIMATTSRACRLGQYDYSRDPDYMPNQEEVDKRRWKDDPFYGWRKEISRAEGRGGQAQGMLGYSPASGDSPIMGGDYSRGILQERHDPQSLENWQRDPFHGWLQTDKVGQPESNLEKVQEAVVARRMMRLPSFREADKRRFPEDHREYAAPHEVAAQTRGRWMDQALQEIKARPEKRWKEDAFFGWLPGRGPDTEQEHQLQRPLHLARDMRLPSFSEAPDLLGVTGKPEAIGILSVWVNCAFGLRYGDESSLRGKPSACVRLRVGDGPEKVTSTVPTDTDPRWNTPAMVFEVGHASDTLSLEVMDLANPRPERHLHHYFLGRVEKAVEEIQLAALESQQHGTRARPVLRFREVLHGAASQDASIDFEVSFEAYVDAAPPPRSQRHENDAYRYPRQISDTSQRSVRTYQQPRRGGVPRSNASFRSNETEELAEAGTLSVRICCAYNLVNKDTGLFGDVSDPFVTLRLASQSEDQRKRTHTINNNLDPVWNTKPFLFPLKSNDDVLILEVWDENMLTQPDFLGRLEVPLHFLVGHQDKLIPIRDRLQGVEHGELEVEVGYSPA